jgi:uncharacterized membrane-anchored protein
VTVPEQLAAQKPHLASLLAGTQFVQGERYEDFSSSTDSVAEYGLSGLVMAGAGLGAAKLVKLGLLAKSWNVILALLLAGKKFAIIGLAALAGLLKRYFGKSQAESEQSPDEEPKP